MTGSERKLKELTEKVIKARKINCCQKSKCLVFIETRQQRCDLHIVEK